MDRFEKALHPFEAGLALERHELRTPLRPSLAPFPRDRRDLVGHIAYLTNDEARLREQRLVEFGRSEEKEPDRAAIANLLVGQLPGDDDWVGEQQAPPGSQHAIPIA